MTTPGPPQHRRPTGLTHATTAPGDAETFQAKPSIAVSRGFDLIDAFLSVGHTVSLTELSRHTGIPKSTVFRILLQLTSSGHVIRSGHSYRLGIKMFELGNHFVHAHPHGLKAVAAPFLGDLFLEFGATVGLSILDNADVILTDQLTNSRMVMDSPVVGGRATALTTASGKAMLAFADVEAQERAIAHHLAEGRRTPRTLMHAGQIRQQLAQTRQSALAYARDEFSLGGGAIASPILVNGRAIAAVSVSARRGKVDRGAAENSILRTARKIAATFITERELGGDYREEEAHWDLCHEFPTP